MPIPFKKEHHRSSLLRDDWFEFYLQHGPSFDAHHLTQITQRHHQLPERTHTEIVLPHQPSHKITLPRYDSHIQEQTFTNLARLQIPFVVWCLYLGDMISLRGRFFSFDSLRCAVSRCTVTCLSGPGLAFRKVCCRVLSAYPSLPTRSCHLGLSEPLMTSNRK